jgi:hypothetical protein
VSSVATFVAVCASERSISLTPGLFYSQATRSASSPIDDFYTYLTSLITLGDPRLLAANPTLGKVLLLGIVSATEYYFRAVLAGVLFACPLSRKHAYTEQLSFGATEYYSKLDLGFALLEGHSFSSKKELISQTARLLDLRWKEQSSIASAVDEYDKLCQFRHAAVHSRGDISVRNLQSIGTPVTSGRLAVVVDIGAFQESAAICQNVVRAYNSALYQELLQRWLNNGVLQGQWKTDRLRFTKLHDLFKSSIDIGTPAARDAYQLFLPSLQKAIAGRASRK